MTTTVWKVSRSVPGGEAAADALRQAGIGILEADSWDDAAEALRSGRASLVVADSDAISALAKPDAGQGELPRERARKLAHDLRTPLSAMAGWLHLIETGRLDEAGLKNAIDRLHGNIDDQVRTIDRHLGTPQEGQH